MFNINKSFILKFIALIIITQSSFADDYMNQIQEAACKTVKDYNDASYDQQIIAIFYWEPDSVLERHNPYSWDTDSFNCHIDQSTYTDYEFDLIVSYTKSADNNNYRLNLSESIGCVISAGTYNWECYYNFITRSERWLTIGVQQRGGRWYTQPFQGTQAYQSGQIQSVADKINESY